jgi:hypothetical protein
MDHIQSTPGFTLQHLQFLVIDEADRLLSQRYQDWVLTVLRATQGVPPAPIGWAACAHTLRAGERVPHEAARSTGAHGLDPVNTRGRAAHHSTVSRPAAASPR